MTINISLPDEQAIARLNHEASKYDANLWVHSLDGLVRLDARSFLGLKVLVGKACKLVAEDDANPKMLTKIVKKAKL